MSTRHPYLRQLSGLSDGNFVRKHHDRLISFFHLEKGVDGPVLIAVPHDELNGHMLGEGDGAKFPGIETATGNDTLAWVWPWDIVRFARSVPSRVLGFIGSHPHAAYKFFADLHNSGKVTREAVEKLEKMKSDSVVNLFFRRMGTHNDFKTLCPNAALWCRVISGDPPPSPMPEPEKFDTMKRVLEIIVEVCEGLGIIIGETGAAMGLILAIISVAISVGGTSPVAAAFAAAVAGVLIHLVILGWILAVIITILVLVLRGIIIFFGKTDDILTEPDVPPVSYPVHPVGAGIVINQNFSPA